MVAVIRGDERDDKVTDRDLTVQPAFQRKLRRVEASTFAQDDEESLSLLACTVSCMHLLLLSTKMSPSGACFNNIQPVRRMKERGKTHRTKNFIAKGQQQGTGELKGSRHPRS